MYLYYLPKSFVFTVVCLSDRIKEHHCTVPTITSWHENKCYKHDRWLYTGYLFRVVELKRNNPTFQRKM